METMRTFTPERVAELKKNIDLSDIPEITEEQWSKGHFKNWKPVKQPVSMRMDSDNVQWLKARFGKGYTSGINDIVRWARSQGY